MPAPASPRRTPLARRAWALYLALGLLGILVAQLVPDGAPADAAYMAVAVLGPAGSIAGLLLHRPAVRRPWVLFAVCQTAFFLGDAALYLPEAVGLVVPGVTVTDLLWLLAYPPAIVALVVLARRRTDGRDKPGALDSAITVVVLGTLAFVFLMGPIFEDSSAALMEKTILSVYSALDVVVLLAVLHLALLPGRRGVALWLLLISFPAQTVSDMIYTAASLDGVDLGAYIEPLWLFAYIAWGAAALHPDMSRLTDFQGLPADRGSRGRLGTLLAIAALLPLVVCLVAVHGDRNDLARLGAAAVVLFGLVLARIWATVRQRDAAIDRHRASAARELVLRHAGTALAAATELDEVARVAAEARAALDDLPHAATAIEALARQAELADERIALTESVHARRSALRFEALVQHASDLILITGPDSVITYASPSSAAVVGVAAPQLLGRNVLDLVHLDDHPRAMALRVLDGTGTRGELRLVAGERELHVDVTVRDLTAHPEVRGFVLTIRDITERHELEERLGHQAFHDDLTGLANRALLRERLGQALRRRAGRPAVLLVDLDDFKTINDSLGHDAGDVVLTAVAARMDAELRAGDTVARLGGDEFALLLEDADDAHVEDVARRLLHAVTRPIVAVGHEVSVDASIGIALGDGEASVEDLLRNADLAMYEAKLGGKGRWARYAPAMHRAAVERLELHRDLQQAVGTEAIVVHYQPLVDIPTGATTGCEALVRWQHPTRGLLNPGSFVELAEETGLIADLGRQVLRQACADAARIPGLTVSVNVSPRQIEREDLVDDVRRALGDAGLPAERLMVEVTEGLFLEDVGLAIDRLATLRDLGVRVAVDDFGTGYSSLSYLGALPLDVLKIGKPFIDRLAGDEPDSALVQTIVDLSRSLGLRTIAEGVEGPEQLERLEQLGCDVAQGYLLGRPMALAAFEAHIAPAAASSGSPSKLVAS